MSSKCSETKRQDVALVAAFGGPISKTWRKDQGMAHSSMGRAGSRGSRTTKWEQMDPESSHRLRQAGRL